jgi:hypothetical protein
VFHILLEEPSESCRIVGARDVFFEDRVCLDSDGVQNWKLPLFSEKKEEFLKMIEDCVGSGLVYMMAFGSASWNQIDTNANAENEN